MTVEEKAGVRPEIEWPRAPRGANPARYLRWLQPAGQLVTGAIRFAQLGQREGRASRFARFLVVGGVTLLINSGFLAFWTEVFHIYYLLSAVLATQGASLCGFCLTEFWVFRAQRSRAGRLGRLVKFLLMNNVVLLLRSPLMYVFTTGFGIHYVISNIFSVGILTLIRYALADSWIWQIARAAEAGPELSTQPAEDSDPR